MDIGEEKDIHPANKQDVGLRLARLALHNDYGQKDLVKTGPLYRNQSLHTTYIDLSFDYVGSGLIAKNDLLGFEIATENGSFFLQKPKLLVIKYAFLQIRLKTLKGFDTVGKIILRLLFLIKRVFLLHHLKPLNSFK